MSSEELAALARTGSDEALLSLWQQVRRLVAKNAGKWAAFHSSNGAEMEDLMQGGFIALIRAVSSFDSSAGTKFSTWFFPFLKSEFARAAGRGTRKQQRDPLQTAVSLDIPVGGDEDEGESCLLDFQPDPAAERAFERVEHREDISRLHAVLMELLDTLPPCQKSAVLARFWGGRTLEHNEGQNLQLALRSLRSPRVCQRLRAFL